MSNHKKKIIIAGIILLFLIMIPFNTTAIDPDEALPHYHKEKQFSPSIDPDLDTADISLPYQFNSMVDPDSSFPDIFLP